MDNFLFYLIGAATLTLGLLIGHLFWRWQDKKRQARRQQFINMTTQAGRHWPTSDAPERAREIFISHLTPNQRRTLERDGYIEETSGGHRYRIYCDGSTSGNIIKRRADKKQHRGCIVFHYPHHYLPKYDLYLSQLLMLRANPKKFDQIAIWSGEHHYYD